MSRHSKLRNPSGRDLKHNPLIGGSKGVVMAQASSEDIEEIEGTNTFEGAIDNDTSPAGGLEDFEHPHVSRRQPRNAGPRKPLLQGRKTHEQQLRTLERKPDLPDERQIEQATAHPPQLSRAYLPRRDARQSEFPVSRGGMNQESQHNKHNHQTQSGHKPPLARVRGRNRKAET